MLDESVTARDPYHVMLSILFSWMVNMSSLDIAFGVVWPTFHHRVVWCLNNGTQPPHRSIIHSLDYYYVFQFLPPAFMDMIGEGGGTVRHGVE